MSFPSSVFSKIFGAIKKAVVVVSHAFVALVGQDQAKKFAEAALDILHTHAGAIVLEIVSGLESLTPALDGSTKRAQAFSAVLNAFEKEGIAAKDSYINLLIEAAVAAVKGTFTLVEGHGAPEAPNPSPSAEVPGPAPVEPTPAPAEPSSSEPSPSASN